MKGASPDIRSILGTGTPIPRLELMLAAQFDEDTVAGMFEKKRRYEGCCLLSQWSGQKDLHHFISFTILTTSFKRTQKITVDHSSRWYKSNSITICPRALLWPNFQEEAGYPTTTKKLRRLR